MELVKELGIVKKKHREGKKKLTREFKRIKDAHDRLNKSREDIDALTKISRDISNSLEKCEKKTCEYHHTKLYEHILTNIESILVQLQDTKKELLHLNNNINDQSDQVKKIEIGLVSSQFKMSKLFVKAGIETPDRDKKFIYKQDSISTEDDSPFAIQNDYIFPLHKSSS